MKLGINLRSPHRVSMLLAVAVAAAASTGVYGASKAPVPELPSALVVVSNSDGRGGLPTVGLNPGLARGQRFGFQFGSGPSLILERVRFDDLGGGNFVWQGRVEGHPLSRVTLSQRGGVVAGVIEVPWLEGNEVYEIEPTPDGCSVLVPATGEPATDGCETVPLAVPLADPGAMTDAVPATPDNPALIDVLVVYTPASRLRYGQAGLEAKIQQAIAEANTAYANSQVFLQLNLLSMQEVNYTETGNLSDALSVLQNPVDGQMDEVHTWRNTAGADIVMLIDEDSNYCGMSYVMQTVATSFESYAFGAVYSGCLSQFSLAHEIGHILGCQHDRANSSSAGAYPYAYGYTRCATDGTGFRTIMAYPCNDVPRINFFSSPYVAYSGYPTGVAYEFDPADSAENARDLNNTGPTAAAFRLAPVPLPAAPASLAATAQGSSAIQLTWTDQSANETGFKIERSLDGATWAEIGSVALDQVEFVDGGSAPVTTYFYRVRAYNGSGYSEYSNVASATTADVSANVPPAAPKKLSAHAASATQIDLAWKDNSDNESGFVVEEWKWFAWSQIADLGPNVTNYAHTGLRKDSTHLYRVKAYNAYGSSAYSNLTLAKTAKK